MIILEVSWWYMVGCLLVAILVTATLYYKNMGELSKKMFLLLSTLRFTATFLIALLLLSPIMKSTKERVEKPIIVVAHDNSESILFGSDSLFVKNALQDKLKTIECELGDVASIESYTFGGEVKKSDIVDFTEKMSNYAELIYSVKNDYYNRNIAGLVIVGDGISNAGSNPLYISDNMPFSVYSVALGDTVRNKDLFVSRLTNNDITYKGNKFPLEVIVEAKLLGGKSGTISVVNGGKVVEKRDFEIDSNDFYEVMTFNIEATGGGIQRYDVLLTKFDDEVNKGNNSKTFYINVLEEKQNIAIIASAVHPDVGALKRSLSGNINYAVELFVGNTNVDLSKFDAVVLHQIPDKRNMFNGLINKIKEKDMPALVVVGSNTSLIDLNKMGFGVDIVSKGSMNEALPVFNSLFSAFKVKEDTQKLIDQFPPLKSPLGTYNVDKKAITMTYQRIGSYTTDMPLFMFYEADGNRYGVILGENIWRWRLFCYDKMDNFDAFDEMISKTMQYLVTVNDKSRFRIKCDKSVDVDSDVMFVGELYNDNYELVNDVEVSLVLKNDIGNEFNYTLNATTNDNYTLNVGKLAAGIYKYVATCNMGNNKYSVNGEFLVSSVNLESVNTVANHKLLSALATKHNGIMVYPDNIEQLIEKIKQQSDLKPVSYTTINYDYIADKWWMLALIILLLSTEWFLRKWSGKL